MPAHFLAKYFAEALQDFITFFKNFTRADSFRPLPQTSFLHNMNEKIFVQPYAVIFTY